MMEIEALSVENRKTGLFILASIAIYVCVCYVQGVTISVVLNDLCSMCNWVALPEISVGFNAETELHSGKATQGLQSPKAALLRSLSSFPKKVKLM